MSYDSIVVKAARDEDAGVWFVVHSDLPGLNAEADTLDELVAKLPAMVRDLLEAQPPEDGDSEGDRDVPISLVAYAQTRVRIRAAA